MLNTNRVLCKQYCIPLTSTHSQSLCLYPQTTHLSLQTNVCQPSNYSVSQKLATKLHRNSLNIERAFPSFHIWLNCFVKLSNCSALCSIDYQIFS